ncbi:MAG TPA: MBL fold metallo-hydrolase [Acidimicrobiales bacterium]|jgi:glyoxylase-like metal-dependent hydrolase (beta-lactamase superfamily II)
MNENLYFRQFLSGSDFAVGDAVALSMRNFSYAIGDCRSGEAVLVDPAYRPGELLTALSEDGMTLVGVIATHYHPDHIGGTFIGQRHIAGIKEIVEERAVPIHVHAEEVDLVIDGTGVGANSIVAHDDGEVVEAGGIAITLIHTPGHTPGSQSLLVEGRLLSGDTLFVDGCGRTDFPGGDSIEMYRSLIERLGEVGDDVELFPGHKYSPESSLDLGAVRARNRVFAAENREQWLAMFGSA